MITMLNFLANILLALWIGAGTFLMAVAAPAAFRHAPDRPTAAEIVGTMLDRWHWIAIAAPLILLAIEFTRRDRRKATVVLLVVALIVGGAQLAADLRIASIRASSPVPISSLDAGNPVRRQFGMLHGASSALMLLQVIAAVAILGARRNGKITA
jgi:hypothetical protein